MKGNWFSLGWITRHLKQDLSHEKSVCGTTMHSLIFYPLIQCILMHTVHFAHWCFWPMVLEKTLESPLDCKKIKPINPKGNQSCIFIGRTDAEAEAPILWPADVKNWLIGKDPDAGKDWRQEEMGTPEDEMVGWPHWLTDMSLSRLLVLVMDREAWHASVHGFADWTECFMECVNTYALLKLILYTLNY